MELHLIGGPHTQLEDQICSFIYLFIININLLFAWKLIMLDNHINVFHSPKKKEKQYFLNIILVGVKQIDLL